MVSIARAPRRDLGQLLSRLLCAVFAVVGAIPLLAGFLVRTPQVQVWAADETARLLQQELGVTAEYDVALEVVPLRLTISDLMVPAANGQGAAVRAAHIKITPSIFSLLAGKLDAGDIEIEKPQVRLVFEEGQLKNLKYRTRSPQMRSGSERAPFHSLAVTEAKLDISYDNMRVTSPLVDIDVFAESGSGFEVALRMADATLHTTRRLDPKGGAPKLEHDEDAICRVDVRLSTIAETLTVRRLSLLGVADKNPALASRPSCDTAADETNHERVAARVSSLRVDLKDSKLQSLAGHVMLRGPTKLANRALTDLPLEGWLAFAGDVGYGPHARLPDVSGRIRGAALKLDGVVVANHIDAQIQASGESIRFPNVKAGYADADVEVHSVLIEPFKPGAPMLAKQVDIRHMTFPGLMRDLAVTPNTIVRWNLDHAVASNIRAQLVPFRLDAELKAETSDFEVTDSAWHDPERTRMIAVDRAKVRGQIAVDLEAFRFLNTQLNFGKSHVLVKAVSIGFEDELSLSVPKGSKIDLSDISPLVQIPMAGIAEIDASMTGVAPDVRLKGAVSVKNFVFGGFPVADTLTADYSFVPLKLELANVRGNKNHSKYQSTSARLEFDTAADVRLDALVESSSLDVRDFLAMWNFAEDPRWTHLKGHGKAQARVHYELGGPVDRCGGGNLKVAGSLDFAQLEAFEERYDSGTAEFDFHWTDFDATYRGFSLDVPNFHVTKGAGSLAGSFEIKPGAKIHGKLLGSGVPISKIDALGDRVNAVEGYVSSAVGEITGSLDAVAIRASASLSEVKLADHELPPSEFSVRLEPVLRPQESLGTSKCGALIATDFDRSRYERDEVQGTFYVTGQLFGGQVRFNDLELTAQRSKVWKGQPEFENFNLAALWEFFSPGTQGDFTGRFTGSANIAAYPVADPARANLALQVREFEATHSGLKAKLAAPQSGIKLKKRKLSLENLALAVTTSGGQSGVFDVKGQLSKLGKAPEIDAELTLRTTDLSTFATLIPNAERAKGQVNGSLTVRGALARPNVKGGLDIAEGEVELEGLKTPISDITVQVRIDPTEVRVVEGTARIGGGRLRLQGRAPIHGTSIGTARADLEVKGLNLSLEEGIRATVDSRLRAVYSPGEAGTRALPRVTGDVTVISFDYTRPMTMTADLSSFARRGQRTKVESYDPEADSVEFDVQLRSQRPLHIANGLLETDLVVDSSGLRLKGTNQRFGMLGRLKLKPGGQIKLRNHEFEIRQGWVRFDDLNEIAPEVDVTATTDYRRFEDVSGPESGGATTASSGVSSSSLGGQWRINLHAYGDPENLKIDLTSTPNLPQDDIFLLLTVGLTRAELDQNRSAAVGSSVALEALGTLSGADRAVQDAVPVIDNASMGSAYNPKSGRTEPTITIGKRLAEKIRAQVTTGLSDSSKVESSLRWQMNQQVSVEGSYGNVNDISSSSLGNVGADIRWRLEFD